MMTESGITREDSDVGGFILVGGESRRMGCDKAWLEISGKPLLLRAAELLRPYVDSITLLGSNERYGAYGFPVLPDRWLGRGPLAALLTGLESARHEWNLFVACDLPLLDGRFFRLLLRCRQEAGFDAVVAMTSIGWQPLCAAYHRSCVPVMQKALEVGQAGIIDVLPKLRVNKILNDRLHAEGFREDIFENVNSPEDWQRISQQFPRL